MFTQEEFDIMVEELLAPELSYEMLLTIVERFKAPIGAWCAADKTLRGRGYEDEIHQNFRIRVTNCCIDSFLRRDGVGTVNRDTEWFRRWLYTVAENIKRDQARAVRREDYRRGGDLTLLGEEEPLFLTVERRESLKRSFAIVLDTSVAPYKVLTWVGLSLLILENKTNKIEGKDLLLREFEEKTLAEMLETVFRWSRRLPWLALSEAHKRKWVDVLMTPLTPPQREAFHLEAAPDVLLYGEVRYRECFMAKGGAASISDWFYRMNQIIVKGMNDEASND